MKTKENIKFSGKAIYEIQAIGNYDVSSSELFGDMLINVLMQSENKYKLILKGWLRDQAELMGILNILYEMHFSVLSVKVMQDEMTENE